METIYTTHKIEIDIKSVKNSINLWAFGDVHRDATSCDEKRWKWFLNKAAKDDPQHTYYIGMGDYHDLASAREQVHLNRNSLHETTMESLDEMVEKNNRKFAKEIKQMNGRLIGLVDGNHNWRFPNGITASEDLANRMGCPHLGWLSHITLNFKIGKKTQNVYIVACHGRAGGKRIGTSINQVEDMKAIFPMADIYIMGHNHDRGAWPIDILYPTHNGHIKQKRQFLCRSGSFKKAYETGKSAYEVGRLLRPADLGALKLVVGFHYDMTDGVERIITDIEAVI